MANAVGEDLEGKVVLIKKEILVEEYHEDKKRAFYAIDGFGTSPNTIGEAVFGYYLYDGKKSRIEGRYVDEVVAESLADYDGRIHASVIEKLNLMAGSGV